MKKVVFLLSLTLFMSIDLAYAKSNSDDCVIASGFCGAGKDSTSIRWKLTCDSVLYINGYGAMRDFRDTVDIPWYRYYYATIKRIELSDSLTHIGSFAFYYMQLLDTVIIPQNVVSIGEMALASSGVQTLLLPDHLERISSEAFAYCRRLYRVWIPQSVESIAQNAFYASGLTQIEVEENNPVYSSVDGVLFRGDTMTLFFYPPAKVDSIYYVPSQCDTILPNSFNYYYPPVDHVQFVRCPAYMYNVFSDFSSTDFYIPCGTKEQFVALTDLQENRFIERVNMPAYDVQLQKQGNGTITSYIEKQTCDSTVMELRVNPSTGYHFVRWLEDSIPDNPRYVTITKDTTFTALLEPNEYFIRTYAEDSTKGKVTYVYGSFAYGTTIDLTATPFEGYAFKGWSDSKSAFACRTYAVTRAYRVTGDADITALFGALEDPKTGTCGDSLTWSLDCDGVLTIRGTGVMDDYNSEKNTPWYNNDSYMGTREYLPIRSVVIEEGVTRVGKYTFRNCSTIVSISLPSTLISIGEQAFRHAAITSLSIPSSVTTIEPSAFYDCANLSAVTCCAVVPPTNERGSRFFSNTYTFALYVPCGTKQAYSASPVWKYWTPVEGVFDYSVGDAIVLQEPTCLNNSTLIFQAKERAGYFFSQWSDGNTDNPRTVQLETGVRFVVEAQYSAGLVDTVCPGYVWEENGEQYIINADTIIGYRHFFVYTHNKPMLTEDDYPIYQAQQYVFMHTEKRLREEVAKINPITPTIESIHWDMVYNENGDTLAQYTMITSCADTLRDAFPIMQKEDINAVPMACFTTEGKNFWVGLTLATNASGMQNPQEPYLMLSSRKGATVQISNPAYAQPLMEPVVVPQNGSVRVDVPKYYWYPDTANTISDIAKQAGRTYNLGLHLVATEDISVVATQWMYTSSDVSTILPTEMLQSEYITQDYPPYNNTDESYSTITILAPQNYTIVEITPATTTYDNHPAGVPYTVSLQDGQTYYVLSQNQQSLSGTRVKEINGHKIAVFQGNVLTQVPTGLGDRDCLYEQAIPLVYWGNEFVITRSLQKDANRVRVTAAEDGTTIQIDQQLVKTLNAGETYEFEMSIGDLSKRYSRLPFIPDVIQSNAVYLRTSCPVAVYSYDVGKSYSATETEMEDYLGDPSMVWVAPLEQQAYNLNFGIPNVQYKAKHYVNIVSPTEFCAQTIVRTEQGTVLPVEWNIVAGNPHYSYARMEISYFSTMMNMHISNPHGFVAHCYENGDKMSYAYALGAQSVSSQIIADTQFCINEPAIFGIPTGSNGIDYITWNFGDGEYQRSTDNRIEHTYQRAGEYTVYATVYSHRECPFDMLRYVEWLDVSVLQPDTNVRDYEICQGESFIHNGTLYSAPTQDTIYYDCDSVEIFTLLIADCTVEPEDTVVVEPETTTADFTWTIVPDAETYTLIIWADSQHTIRLCTLTFNAAGYLIRIDFGVPTYAPAYTLNKRQIPQRHKLIASAGTTTLTFTITGLDSGHEYYYELYAYDQEENEIDAKIGSFSTTTETTTDIKNMNVNEVDIPVKFIWQGNIFILRGNKTYTLQGQEVR